LSPRNLRAKFRGLIILTDLIISLTVLFLGGSYGIYIIYDEIVNSENPLRIIITIPLFYASLLSFVRIQKLNQHINNLRLR